MTELMNSMQGQVYWSFLVLMTVFLLGILFDRKVLLAGRKESKPNGRPDG